MTDRDIRPHNESAVRAATEPADPFVDRVSEADRIVEFLLSAKHKVLVIYGRRGSGKTELVRQWVIPRLSETAETDRSVFYGDYVTALPDALEGADGSISFDAALEQDSIVFLDSVDKMFHLPRDERMTRLDELFARLERSSAETVVVLIADTRDLTSIYALGSYIPGITDAVLEVRSVGIAEGLKRLADLRADVSPSYSDELLHALSDEAEDFDDVGMPVTFELLRVLDEQLRATQKPSLEIADYREIGGLSGILRTYLEQRLEELASGKDHIARALLHQALSVLTKGGSLSVEQVAARLDVATAKVRQIFESLTGAAGLLRDGGEGRYNFVPIHLGHTVEDEMALIAQDNEVALRIVREGLRSWQQLGTLLPRERFEDVHRRSKELELDEEQVHFLLRCALLHENGGCEGAARYWLGRVADTTDGMDILLTASLDDDPEVRARAVCLLWRFKEPEVRKRLALLALTDPDETVRSNAVSSLEPMQDDETRALFVREARDANGSHRHEAVAALRIFKSTGVVEVLHELVSHPETPLELRTEAIHVLGSLGLRESADALMQIALRDEDEEDRDGAAKALARCEEQAINEHILATLGSPRQKLGIRLARALAAIVAVLGGVIYTTTVLATALLVTQATLLLVVIPLLLLPVTRVLLLRLRDRKIKRASALGVLGAALFVWSTVSVFFWAHGLAHALTKQKLRGLTLFVIQIVSMVLSVLVVFMQPAFQLLGPLSDVIALPYIVAAVVMFFGSYVYDVVPVMFDALVFTGTTDLRHRRAAVYRAVMGNPKAAAVVFAQSAGTDRERARRAQALLKQFGASIQPNVLLKALQEPDNATLVLAIRGLGDAKKDDTIDRLEQLWRTADASLRRRIGQVLWRNPNERSVNALKRVKSEMGVMERARAGLAQWHFRFKVWPKAVFVAILLIVPVFGVFTYHGYKLVQNPAWPLIIDLRRPVFLVGRQRARQQKPNIVAFLAETYPDQSANELMDILHEERFEGDTTVHLALLGGLAQMQNVVQEDGARMREELVSHLEYLENGLGSRDSANFELALSALDAMIQASDSNMVDSAIIVLEQYSVAAAGARVHDTSAAEQGRRRAAALHAINGSPYPRSLPSLGRIARNVQQASGAGQVTDTLLRQQIALKIDQEIATLRAFDDLSQRAEASQRLSHYVQDSIIPRNYLPGEQQSALDQLLAAAPDCDRNGDGSCDATDRALGTIAGDPAAEDGYRNLLTEYRSDIAAAETEFQRLREQYPSSPWPRRYLAIILVAKNPNVEYGYSDLLSQYGEEYAAAEQAFVRLKGDYPRSVWPGKYLAFIYHEYLIDRPTALEDSYREMTALRNLESYHDMRVAADPADYFRFEADYAELALTTGYHDVCQRVARGLLQITEQDLYQLNMNIFIYIAMLMQGDWQAADTQLTALESVVQQLPDDYYNAWVYPGTRLFVQESELPDDMKQAVVGVLRDYYWYQPEEADSVIAANRAALGRFVPR